MDALSQLHKEMYENLAYREEQGYKPGNLNRWINLCEKIEAMVHDAQRTAADTGTKYLALKAKYQRINQWLKAIGETEENINAIPAEYYPARSLKQELSHFNNPHLLWIDAISYRHDIAERQGFIYAMQSFTNAKERLLNDRTS